ncbi:hypothetical protein JY651_28400 [Pyxidicoccus parkwayensis]|uniref:Uncharacterized protein n=1 Tax=Pyxidicoccus parkwayensis TaxID=2813578 RepID=A0ABX7NLJ1_9BACT|nr:hypothetical protein [Pyxidicoccus parkwaysis]QSQ19258.1 hypothetical protein JY651_28400 [Pyxidicoccus parkwaysis]
MPGKRDKKKWHYHHSVRPFANVGGRELAHISDWRDDGMYDGESETLMEAWGVKDDSGGYTHFDSLGALLKSLEPAALRAAMMDTPEGFAWAVGKEYSVGRLVGPEEDNLVAHVLRERGLGARLRPPAFDGETLTFQALKVPPLWGPPCGPEVDGLARLVSIRFALDGMVMEREVVEELDWVERPKAEPKT